MEQLMDRFSAELKDGYNPIKDKDIKSKPVSSSTDLAITQVTAATPFIQALRFALTQSSNVKETIADTGSVLNSIEAAAET
jgi:site-specific recombinase XerD